MLQNVLYSPKTNTSPQAGMDMRYSRQKGCRKQILYSLVCAWSWLWTLAMRGCRETADKENQVILRETHAHTQHSAAPAWLTVILTHHVSAKRRARITHTMPCCVWGLLKSLQGCKCNFPDQSSWYAPVTWWCWEVLLTWIQWGPLEARSSWGSMGHPLVVWGWLTVPLGLSHTTLMLI